MKIVDAKGKNCPIPVVMTKKEIDAGAKELMVEVDNPIAVQNVSRLATAMSFDVATEEIDGGFRLTLTSNGAAADDNAVKEAILLMNDGVKLAVNSPDTIEHLQTLVNKGVELLVCGTCLNFYGLSEELKVGTVSNMYDILSRMQAATKVISL